MDPEVTDVSAPGASSAPAQPAPETAAPATAEQSDKGYVDAVLSALKPEEGSQPPKTVDQKTDAPKGTEPEKPGDPKAAEADDPTEDELKNYSPHARKRIGQLLGQRREARAEVEAARAEVEPLKAQAKIAGDLQSFVQTAGLTKDDLDAGFSIMAAMRSNPQEALAQLMPIVQGLQQMVGNVLPDDLASDVREGKVTVERALELSRHRASSAREAQTRTEQLERQKLQEQQTQHQQAVQIASTAVSDWERSKSTSDPDWHLKQGRIAELVELNVRRNGFPTSPQAAVDLHQKALDTVTAELRKFRPAPRPMQMASGHANPNSVSEPKSHLEAAMMGLAAGRG